MATTSPDNLRTPNPGDPYNLVPDLQTLAQDVQDALIARGNVFRGTAAQRAAYLSTASPGMLWQDTDGIGMLWKKAGAVWVPAVWRWAGTTSQMNAFTQAPNGFEWFNTTDNSEYVRLGGAWKPVGAELLRGKIARRTIPGNDVITETINFPAGYFDQPPVVVAGVDSSARDTSVTVDLVTTTSASVRMGVNGTSSRVVGATWVAMAAS